MNRLYVENALWQDGPMVPQSEQVYCAFCRIPRKVPLEKHLTYRHFLFSAALSALLMLAAFDGLDGRALVFFVVFLTVAEIFIHVRWRINVQCPYCGFDPVLYKTDQKRAVAKVRGALTAWREKPESLLLVHDPIRNLENIVRQKSSPDRDIGSGS